MADFQGDVTVTADGVEYAAVAELHSWAEDDRRESAAERAADIAEGLTDWNGSIDVAGGESAAWKVMEAEDRSVRMPDGRAASFVVNRRFFGTGVLLITGSAEPPF
ncbi:hypothetical protein [Streptomyces genisteinicus]|uniref:Uncharacterized protein n=1 Tax=Streptomyces genisteinicus TaxID=2768068 RepID=A0A7H0I2M0_9ACTN|nr:hypothetical protein [Streptomyces genisteinicus]QNP67036.1 hypothetical protein IAG43_31815 [Streptomyces genisteinicus]